MSHRASECPHCGAKIGAHSTAYCEYCGTALPREEPREPAPRHEPSRRDRFDALLAHPDLERLKALQPSSAALVASGAFSVVGALAFVVIAGIVTGIFFSAVGSAGRGAPPGFGGLFRLVPVVVLVVGIGMLLKAIGGTARVAGSPMRKTPARIVDKRTKVSGGGDNSRARTHYFVTLEGQDGRRKELRASGPVAGTVANDDMGLAYVKGGHLVAFERVDV